MRNDPELAAFAIRLLQRGKHYNQVRVAVGRKIAVRAYSLLKRFAKGEPDVHYIWRNPERETILIKEAKQLTKKLWDEHESRKT